jgi:hypothetical protein
MVAIATDRGTTSTRRTSKVIRITAGSRRLPNSRCARSSNGQVATTTIVAQISAGRKGCRIHSDAAISTQRKSTASVGRAISMCFSTGIIVQSFQLSRFGVAPVAAHPGGAARRRLQALAHRRRAGCMLAQFDGLMSVRRGRLATLRQVPPRIRPGVWA